MASFRFTGRERKAGFVVVMLIAVIIIITSGVVLVRSAKLHTGNVEGATTKTSASELKVKASSEVPFATSDTGASATLQGASPSAGSTNTGGLKGSSGVSVHQVTPSTKLTCDTAAQTRLTATYTTQKANEDTYHKSMLKLLKPEGQLLLSNENNRYDLSLTKLKTTLNTSLAAISCPLVR